MNTNTIEYNIRVMYFIYNQLIFTHSHVSNGYISPCDTPLYRYDCQIADKPETFQGNVQTEASFKTDIVDMFSCLFGKFNYYRYNIDS